jgi:hypothetical protein
VPEPEQVVDGCAHAVGVVEGDAARVHALGDVAVDEHDRHSNLSQRLHGARVMLLG